ncbi:hypothetical protein OUZ56_024094 [Daphnia magna]|uniref:Uncharacterized protein n=1 Tax=Daphnia magna TaxID=35525 RepID=A0ABR0B049_9CRUS|nr:hypothetical protein OUZ56_024094 [Daphnia magna]
MRQHLPQFPLGETTRNLLVSRQTQNGVSQSHDGDDDQNMDRISTDKCNAASTTATCPEGSETESMCDSADSYDILSPNGSDDDGVPVSDSDEESYQDCLDEDVNVADDSQRNKLQPEHHKGATILEELDIDLISGIPLDPMHLTDLGVTRKLFRRGLITLDSIFLMIFLGNLGRLIS